MAGIADLAVQGSNRDGDPINTGKHTSEKARTRITRHGDGLRLREL